MIINNNRLNRCKSVRKSSGGYYSRENRANYHRPYGHLVGLLTRKDKVNTPYVPLSSKSTQLDGQIHRVLTGPRLKFFN